MSTNKTNEEPTPLRRSTRSTRGSIKPVVVVVESPQFELSDQDNDDNEHDKIEEVDQVEEFQMSEPSDNDDDEEDYAAAKPKRTSTSTKGKRKSTATIKKDNLANVEKPTAKTNRRQSTKAKQQDTGAKSSTKTLAKNAKSGSKSKKQEPEGEEDGEKKKEEEEIEADNVHIYYELSEKEMKEVNNAFDMNCSTDGDELLRNDDLKTAIRSLGFEPRADEIRKLMEKFSKNDKINRDGFHKIMAFKMGSSPGLRDNETSDEISRVFNLLDLDKTGLITLDNLKSISKELNEEITDEELHEMIAEADIDGDFQINKQEFYNIMKKTSLY